MIKSKKYSSKKDSYLKIVEELEKYSEGVPLINSHHAFDSCACNHEREHHDCDEKCENYDNNRLKTIVLGDLDEKKDKKKKVKQKVVLNKNDAKIKHITKIAMNFMKDSATNIPKKTAKKL